MSDTGDQVLKFDENQRVESILVLDLNAGAERSRIIADRDYDLIQIIAGEGTINVDGRITPLLPGTVMRVDGGFHYSVSANKLSNLVALLYKVKEDRRSNDTGK